MKFLKYSPIILASFLMSCGGKNDETKHNHHHVESPTTPTEEVVEMTPEEFQILSQKGGMWIRKELLDIKKTQSIHHYHEILEDYYSIIFNTHGEHNTIQLLGMTNHEGAAPIANLLYEKGEYVVEHGSSLEGTHGGHGKVKVKSHNLIELVFDQKTLFYVHVEESSLQEFYSNHLIEGTFVDEVTQKEIVFKDGKITGIEGKTDYTIITDFFEAKFDAISLTKEGEKVYDHLYHFQFDEGILKLYPTAFVEEKHIYEHDTHAAVYEFVKK